MPKSIRIHANGGPEVLRWEEVAVGDPGPGEARVRHTAIGVNFIDTYHRSGLYKLPLPTGLGNEAAGRQGGRARRRLLPSATGPIAAARSAPTAKRA
jgi:hypothetical protein